MSDHGCPDGMYPMDTTHPANSFATFAELRAAAEKASDSLNFPISWHIYDESDEDWGLYLADDADEDTATFELVFLMPRKWGQTWGLKTEHFDRHEVQGWLDTFVRAEVMRWYGWTDAPAHPASPQSPASGEGGGAA